MIHVRRHKRETASGKTTTVRAHEREGGGETREAPEWAQPARSGDFAPAASAEPPSWEDEDAAPAGDWWDDERGDGLAECPHGHIRRTCTRCAAGEYPCANCSGSGRAPMAPTAVCNRCSGTGNDPYALR